MTMRKTVVPAMLCIIFASCMSGQVKPLPESQKLEGTWKLLSATLIENGDTTVTDYTSGVSFIKIINNTHFSFLQHDLKKGKDSAAVFVAGGGRYTVKGNRYTEHLEYCSARDWEGHEFSFDLTFSGDTLVQNGIEKVASAGVNRINIEKYVKVRKGK
jgi:hypothetical protein